MAAPICKVFLTRFAPAWFQLSEGEQAAILARLNEAFERVGGKRLVLCDATWSSDHWQGFGVEEFPDVAALQQYMHALYEINWFSYIEESLTAVGTKQE